MCGEIRGKGRDKNVRTVSRFFLFAEQHCFSHTKEGDAYEKMGYKSSCNVAYNRYNYYSVCAIGAIK